MISPFRKDLSLSRVLVKVPRLPLDSIQRELSFREVEARTTAREEKTEETENAPQAQQTQQEESASTSPSPKRRYKSKRNVSSNLKCLLILQDQSDDDLAWYSKWVSGKGMLESPKSTTSQSARNHNSTEDNPATPNTAPNSTRSASLYTLQVKKKEKTFAEVKKRRASYYYHNELLEMDWRLQFCEEEKEAVRFNTIYYNHIANI
jgi:hypothetical protein